MNTTESKIRLTAIAGAVAVSGLTATDIANAESPFHLVDALSSVAQKSISVLEGRCGEGKCGSLRIRLMMDADSDGKITRQEYVAWNAAQAEAEFDHLADEAAAVTPEQVYKNFFEWETRTLNSK